ncbi:hypothetical protein XENOCAPTIV_026727, partial [Xenoophorus captivus]
EGSFYFDPFNLLGCSSCFCFGATDRCQSSDKRRGKVGLPLEAACLTVIKYILCRTSLNGQGMSLIHVASQAPLPDRLHQGRVQLLEDYFQYSYCLQGNWRHGGTNRPVSRQEFMMVLAGLVGLRIRALYFTQSQRLSLGEKCAPGFYREASGLYLGNCVPCECNECDSCAQTLLNDLEQLDIELARMKAQLDNASISGALKERLDKLEKAVSDTKEAKMKAASANNSAANTMDKLSKLRNDIDKIIVTPVNGSLSNVLQDVDQTGKEKKDLLDLSPDDVVFYVGGYPSNFTVDDEDYGQEQSGTTAIPNTDGSVLLGNDKPDNLYKPEDLTYFQASGDVLMDVCTASNPVQLIKDHYTKKVRFHMYAQLISRSESCFC